MYIEFQLPSGAGGYAAGLANKVLNNELHAWADHYNIAYNKKLHKYTVRITFDNDKIYTFFAVTWNPKSETFHDFLLSYKIKDPMKIDRYR